jgi:hypothetical protein
LSKLAVWGQYAQKFGSVLVLLKALALAIELFGINGLKKAGNLMSAQHLGNKGVIAQAIENVSRRRGSTVVYVNAAYTSQMDSRNGTLSGKRCGDKFYCENGEVLQADVNAARNVLARLYDQEIDRWTPYKQVKAILLKRTSAIRLKLLNQDSSCKPFGLSTESELSNTYHLNMFFEADNNLCIF